METTFELASPSCNKPCFYIPLVSPPDSNDIQLACPDREHSTSQAKAYPQTAITAPLQSYGSPSQGFPSPLVTLGSQYCLNPNGLEEFRPPPSHIVPLRRKGHRIARLLVRGTPEACLEIAPQAPAMYTCMQTYIYIYTHMHIYTHIYSFIHMVTPGRVPPSNPPTPTMPTPPWYVEALNQDSSITPPHPLPLWSCGLGSGSYGLH